MRTSILTVNMRSDSTVFTIIRRVCPITILIMIRFIQDTACMEVMEGTMDMADIMTLGIMVGFLPD